MAVDRRTVLQNAQLFASKGQFDAAIAEWRKLTTDSPADGAIFNSIGDLHLKRSAAGDAVTSFLQAATAFRSEGSVLKAIAAYKKVLKVDSSRMDIYRHLGDLNAERGLLSSAIQDYLTLGKHYLKDGRNKEALEVYRKIVSQDPSNLDAQKQVAELCVHESLPDEAIRVYLHIGREHSAAQRYNEAKEAYLSALRLDPENAEAKEIITMMDGGSVPSASRATKSSAAKGGEGNDLMAEATRRIDEGQYAGAEAILAQLLSREPGNPEICQLLARLHLMQGNILVALGEYRFLAGAALRAQDYAVAESLVDEFLRIEPNSVPMLELLGELYQEKGDPATAAQHFGKAVEILLQCPEPGMPTLPAELFEKVQALAPGSAIARKLAPSFDPNAEAVPEPAAPIAESSIAASTMTAPDVMAMPTLSAASTQSPDAEPMPIVVPEPVAAASVEAAPTADMPFRLVDAAAPAAAAPVKPVTIAAPPPAQPVAPVVAAEPTAVPTAPMAAPLRSDVPSPSPASPPPTDTLDAEVRYALGMAYKDMGLLDEAKEEFLLSMKDSGFFVDSCLMMSLCLKEQHHSGQAVQQLEQLIADSRCRGGNAQIVRYELGLLYEKMGHSDRAVAMYQSIPTFHDVPRRLEALRAQALKGGVSAASLSILKSVDSAPLAGR